MSKSMRAYIRKLPKAEIHLHLEGSVDAKMLQKLAKKYGTDLQNLTPEQIEAEFFKYKDFDQFLEVYKLVCQHLRTPEDYVRILDSLGVYFQEQNIRYAEIFFSPAIPRKYERDEKKILRALLSRSKELQEENGCRIQWILDCVRQFGLEAARLTAELATEFRQEGVVGVGLGGKEEARPAAEYEQIFSWIRAHQLYVHVHAGETSGPQQVWDALEILGANRVGHGIQASRDPQLMEYLREHATGLDICLTSNSMTKAWPMLAKHPLPLLYKRGVPLTLNTDDPGLFKTSLNEEYEKAVELFGFTLMDVQHFAIQGVRSAFLAYDEKMQLMSQFQDEIQSLPQE